MSNLNVSEDEVAEIKAKLIEKFVDRLVDDMDMCTMCQIVAEHMTLNFEDYTLDELRTEIEESAYPELLDEVK
jgi:hypothetical protein